MRQYFSSDRDYLEFVEKHRRENYLAGWQWPISWFHCAIRHKMGADLLYEAAAAANKRDLARMLADMQMPVDQQRKSGPVEGDELHDWNLQNLFSDFLLLSGYAIECLLKGILMARDPAIAEDMKKLRARVVTHDICWLCDECGIDIAPEERDLLDLIRRHIEWGKYPVSLHIEDTPSWIEPDDQRKKSLAIGNPFHKDRIKKIVDSVYQRADVLLAAEAKKDSKNKKELR